MRVDAETQVERVSAFCDDVLGRADAVEIARRIRDGEIHSSEAVEAAIGRAQRVDPALNAIATPLFEAARETARISLAGAFAGVPSFIKDTDAVAGSPLRFGTRGLPNTPAPKSSPFVEQFLSLGLINLGKTTLSEFGLTGTTEAVLYGRTHNPWKLGFSPGGSSGGSAALVAAGVVPIAHANDGGGSTRIPASCCGLVGLKPSRGRLVEFEGARLMPIRLQHHGIVSRSVRDTAVFYHAAERIYRNRKLPEIGLVTSPGRRLRIGFFTGLGGGEPAHPECVSAVAEAAKVCEGLGHAVEEVAPPFDDYFHEDFLLLWSMMAFAIARAGRRLVHPELDPTKLEDFTQQLARHFRDNARKAPGAIRRLRSFGRRHAERFDTYDVLMCPTMATPPTEHGFIGPEVPYETSLERMRWMIPFTPVQNVSGEPAMSLPLAQSRDGLPIGIQLAAEMGAERTLIELALELEQASAWPTLG